MSTALADLLAALATDPELASRFAADPAGVARAAGLDEEQVLAALSGDAPGTS